MTSRFNGYNLGLLSYCRQGFLAPVAPLAHLLALRSRLYMHCLPVPVLPLQLGAPLVVSDVEPSPDDVYTPPYVGMQAVYLNGYCWRLSLLSAAPDSAPYHSATAYKKTIDSPTDFSPNFHATSRKPTSL